MSKWSPYENGKSIGTVSSEGGVILRDEEHEDGARITLKQGNDYVSVACHIYGWTDHTRFFGTIVEAQREYLNMKTALNEMMEVITAAGSNAIKIWEAIAIFVRRFPQ